MSNFFTVDPNAMQGLKDEAQLASGGRTRYLRMEAPGKYVGRICPPWSAEGRPARVLVGHNDPYNAPLELTRTNSDGEEYKKRVSPLCFRYIFKNPHIEEILLEREEIDAETKKLYEAYGCPLCILPKKLTELGKKDEARDYWPRTRFITNFYLIDAPGGGTDEEPVNTLYIKDFSKTQWDDIDAEYAIDPEVFDPEKGRNTIIQAKNNKGITRRYNVKFERDSSKLEFDGEPYDLDDIMARGVYSYQECVELALQHRTDYDLDIRLGDLQELVKAA